MQRDTKIIAVSGKGGVGKTTLSAAVVRTLTECYPEARILAIDADPRSVFQPHSALRCAGRWMIFAKA